MHQSSKRRLCRLVFLVGCVFPTLAVVAWATAERLPSTRSARLAKVERMLGMRVLVDSLSTPTPGVYRATGVKLKNVETGALTLTADVATIRSDSGTKVELSGVCLAAEELMQLAATAERSLAVDWPAKVSIHMSRVSWNGDIPSAALAVLADSDLTIRLNSKGDGSDVLGRELLVKLGSAPHGPTLTVVRNRQVSPPATQATLNTAGSKIPAQWVAELGGLLAGAKHATFEGEATITHSNTTSGELHGRVDGVSVAELTQLLIEAEASIQGLEMQWADGCMVRATGTLVGAAGEMDAAVAQMILSQLYQTWQPAAGLAANEPVAFGHLAVAFAIDTESLSLWGACPAEDPHRSACVLDTHGNLLFGPPELRTSLYGVGALLARYGRDGAANLTARLPRTQTR